MQEAEIAKQKQEPEVEIPEFLRGYKDDNKGVGGGWNADTSHISYSKHSVLNSAAN